MGRKKKTIGSTNGKTEKREVKSDNGAFNRKDVALAIKTANIPKDQYLEFATNMYKTAGKSAKDAKDIAYHALWNIKNTDGGINKAAKDGNLEAIKPYLSSETPLEDKADEAAAPKKRGRKPKSDKPYEEKQQNDVAYEVPKDVSTAMKTADSAEKDLIRLLEIEALSKTEGIKASQQLKNYADSVGYVIENANTLQAYVAELKKSYIETKTAELKQAKEAFENEIVQKVEAFTKAQSEENTKLEALIAK